MQKLVHSIADLDIVKSMASKDLSDNDEDEDEDEDEDDDEVMQSIDEDGSEDGGVSDDEEDEDNKLILELFQDITNELSLSPIEISALRLAIVTGNRELQGAMNDFKSDFDALKLKKRLISVSKSVVAETLAEKQFMDNHEDNDNNLNDADDSKEGDFGTEYEDYLRQAQAIVDESNKFDYTKYDNMSSDDDADSESDDSEEEDDNDDGSEEAAGVDNPTTVRKARQQVFPILVAELIKEGIIQKDIGTKLLDMFNKGSDSVHSCLDKYDQTNDMAALIDNLQELIV